jgi:4-amino-4-deoxy-L-arabinose transferase-like glycosyltransferase
MQALKDFWRSNPTACVLAGIGMLVAIRTGLVIATPLEISPDEAQYWRWSRTLDLGYYSKPPLIAWVIALSTSVFGDSEWAIRLLAPLLHGVAAFFLYLLGARAFDQRIGAWSAAIYLLMPGVFLSSTIMSTDVVLLPATAAALYFLWRFRDAPNFRHAIFAGACIGLAMLAKYAALYIYGGAALAALIDRDMRRALLSPAGGALVAASLVVLSPNLIWNAANNFATVSHTADNVNIGGAGFNPLNAFDFVLDQAAVFGPVLLPLLLAGFALVIGRKDKWTSTREFWLICFVAPPLLVILGQEILSRAHANWAASAYPAASILVASWIDRVFGRPTSRRNVGPWIKGGVALNLAIGAIFSVMWVMPFIADATGISTTMKGVRGWKETVAELSTRAGQLDATAIMVDDRELWHGLDYYGRDQQLPPIRTWQRGSSPRSHAEEEGKMQPGEDARVLIASGGDGLRAMIRQDFATIEEIGYLDIPLGPTRDRELKLYLASGYQPAERTAEFEATYAPMREP